MTKEEEKEFLLQFEEAGKKGNTLTVSNIKSALEERLGKKYTYQLYTPHFADREKAR